MNETIMTEPKPRISPSSSPYTVRLPAVCLRNPSFFHGIDQRKLVSQLQALGEEVHQRRIKQTDTKLIPVKGNVATITDAGTRSNRTKGRGPGRPAKCAQLPRVRQGCLMLSAWDEKYRVQSRDERFTGSESRAYAASLTCLQTSFAVKKSASLSRHGAVSLSFQKQIVSKVVVQADQLTGLGPTGQLEILHGVLRGEPEMTAEKVGEQAVERMKEIVDQPLDAGHEEGCVLDKVGQERKEKKKCVLDDKVGQECRVDHQERSVEHQERSEEHQERSVEHQERSVEHQTRRPSSASKRHSDKLQQAKRSILLLYGACAGASDPSRDMHKAGAKRGGFSGEGKSRAVATAEGAVTASRPISSNTAQAKFRVQRRLRFLQEEEEEEDFIRIHRIL